MSRTKKCWLNSEKSSLSISTLWNWLPLILLQNNDTDLSQDLICTAKWPECKIRPGKKLSCVGKVLLLEDVINIYCKNLNVHHDTDWLGSTVSEKCIQPWAFNPNVAGIVQTHQPSSLFLHTGWWDFRPLQTKCRVSTIAQQNVLLAFVEPTLCLLVANATVHGKQCLQGRVHLCWYCDWM